MEPYKDFLAAIQNGMDIETAAYLAGMAPASVFRLLETGKMEQERLSGTRAVKPRKEAQGALELWVEVAKRRAMSIQKHIRVINDAATDGDWKASKFALEHIHPRAYGNQGSNNEIEAAPLGQIEGGL